MTATIEASGSAQPVWADPAEAAFDSWRSWMLAGGIAARTRRDRPQIIDRVSRDLHTSPLEFDTEQLVGWLGTIAGASSRETYYSVLVAWHLWLLRTGRRTFDPTVNIPRPRVPRRKPHPASTRQIERVLATRMSKRTRAMILLAAYQGLRVHEIAKVHGQDIDLEEGTLHVVGKGGLADDLPLHPDIAKLARRFPRRALWFPSYVKPGEPVLGNSVSTVISMAMRRAGVNCSAHDLRHWFGTELVRSGADLRTAQTLLRHGNLQTTAIYIQVASTAQADAIVRLPLLGRSSDSDAGEGQVLRLNDAG